MTGVDARQTSQAICVALTALADRLGIDVLAEGRRVPLAFGRGWNRRRVRPGESSAKSDA